MKWSWSLIAVCLVLAPDGAIARDCPAPYLCAFDGSWAAEGTSFGKPAHVTMRWAPAFDGKFARIDYRILTKTADGKDDVFEGTGFYRAQGNGAYDGTWFDSQGAMHPLEASFTGTALTTHWGVKGKTYGRTVYTLSSADHVEVVDAIQDKEGEWKEFSRNTLKRTE